MTAFPSYAIGAVSVGAGDAVIVGGGGAIWSETNALAGDDIVIAGHSVIVEDVIDTTHLQIDPWPYAAVPAGTPYKIVKRSPLRYSMGQVAADVSRLLGALNTAGLTVIVPATATAPDPSLGEQDQFAIQPGTFKLWLKTGGLWVFQGIFKGFNLRGVWNGVDAFDVNDVVAKDGSSYVAVAPNTNQAPPNATYWMVLAAKGTDGADGAPGEQGVQGTPGTNGIGYGGTSTTSLAIAIATKVFTTQAGLGYNGARVRAASGANPANFMEGVCTYSGSTLTMTVDTVGGSGTKADWPFGIAGQPGTAVGALLAANALSELTGAAATARSNIGINQSIVIAGGTDLNTVIAPGTYACQSSTVTNGPFANGQWYIDVVNYAADPTNYVMQRATDLTGQSGQWTRAKVNGTWQPWVPVVTGGAPSSAMTAAQKAQAQSNIGVGSGAVIQANPGAPTGTANNSPGVMMGLGVSACRITPVFGGRLHVEIQGDIISATGGHQWFCYP